MGIFEVNIFSEPDEKEPVHELKSISEIASDNT
jgi:hypothetical protein